MKKGKSPGDDGIPVAIVKAGGEYMLRQMLQICNATYVTKIAPSDWQRGVISPLFRKGEKSMCDNYRGITLLPHSGKVYTKMLEKRLGTCVESLLNVSQYGFRPSRGTTDTIFVVKMLLEKSWEWCIDKYALFVDLEKAFDLVDREHLWQTLQDQYYNIPTEQSGVCMQIPQAR